MLYRKFCSVCQLPDSNALALNYMYIHFLFRYGETISNDLRVVHYVCKKDQVRIKRAAFKLLLLTMTMFAAYGIRVCTLWDKGWHPVG